MLSINDYKDIIINSLFENGLVNRRIYLKCHPDISELPYDLRTSNVDELMERMDAIETEINKRDEILSDAEYRIGVKQRDIDRLSKRMAKQANTMEKAVDNINKESDKIVKSITKLEDKLEKLDLSNSSDESLRDSLVSRLDKLKKAHNNFFNMDLTPNNITTYKNELSTLEARGVDLHNILVDMNNGGLITKTDLNNGDISSNINRINKNIATYSKNNDSMKKDGQRVNDDFTDIDYITRESKTVITSRDALNEEYDETLTHYLDLGGDKSVKPGFSQDGHGTNIPVLIDEMDKLQKDLGKKYPYYI